MEQYQLEQQLLKDGVIVKRVPNPDILHERRNKCA
jgi:hypothetical protein